MTARTRSHVAIGTVLAGLILVGCADPGALDRTATPEDALARVQGAAAKVTEARSARGRWTPPSRRRAYRSRSPHARW
jgi:hypothetical protein